MAKKINKQNRKSRRTTIAAKVRKAQSPIVKRNSEEVIRDLRSLKPHALEGFVAPLDGVRLEALTRAIKADGQIEAIQVDEHNVVWNGRSRLAALKQLKMPARIVRIASADGPTIALAGLKHREMSVLDEVELVQWAKSNVLKIDADGEGKVKTRDKIGAWLKSDMGWVRRSSPRTIQSYMTLGDQLAEATPAQRQKVANAATVTEAMSVFSKRKAKAQVKRSTRDALRKKLTSLDQQLAKVREPALKKDLRQLKAVIATTIKALEKNDSKVDMKIVAAQSRRKAA